jgi:hypothetical protein
MTIEVGGNLGLALTILAVAACIWAYRRGPRA